MRIVRFHNGPEGKPIYGVLEDDTIYPVDGSPFDDKFEPDRSSGRSLDLGILSVPCEPTKVVALAINYRGASGQTQEMSEPLVFIKGSNSVVPFDSEVELPFESKAWGEAELGVVVRKETRKIIRGEISDYILGYVPVNDVSCENVGNRDHHLARSKSPDGFCPVGHYIDTSYDYKNKLIEAYHNHILIRRGNTNEMIWDPEYSISWLSEWMTLYPGDIVITGAPPRVRERLFLKNGDRYTVVIEGFPKLTTRFYAR